MAEDILNREEALQRRHDRMRKRHTAQLHRRIALLIGFLCVFLGLLIATSMWVMASYTTPLELPEGVSVLQLTVSDQERLSATDFVQGLEDTGISVSFGSDFDDKQLGQQDFTLVFTRGHEVCTRVARVYLFHLETAIRVQLGQETQVSARSFVPDEQVDARLETALAEGVGGAFTLTLHCADREYQVECVVQEDIPPQGIGKELTVEADTMPAPEHFVEGLFDNSAVNVTYQTQPQFVVQGKQKVALVLEDFFGNKTVLEATANVVPAANGPQFTGLDPIRLELGAAISYKAGVQCTDAQDGELTFTVDPGYFDNKTEGEYTISYSATDSDGHRITVLRTVIVESHLSQLVREKAQQVLASLIKPGMTRDQQIWAISHYVRWSVVYVGYSDKSSVEAGAYEGFYKGTGDCYTYYAMVRVLLDALDIPNLECRRTGGTSNHWWNLVQFEDGKYYHVDTNPHRYKFDWLENHYKMTESMIQRYTNEPDVMGYRPNYYVYDHTLPEYQNIEIAQ